MNQSYPITKTKFEDTEKTIMKQRSVRQSPTNNSSTRQCEMEPQIDVTNHNGNIIAVNNTDDSPFELMENHCWSCKARISNANEDLYLHVLLDVPMCSICAELVEEAEENRMLTLDVQDKRMESESLEDVAEASEDVDNIVTKVCCSACGRQHEDFFVCDFCTRAICSSCVDNAYNDDERQSADKSTMKFFNPRLPQSHDKWQCICCFSMEDDNVSENGAGYKDRLETCNATGRLPTLMIRRGKWPVTLSDELGELDRNKRTRKNFEDQQLISTDESGIPTSSVPTELDEDIMEKQCNDKHGELNGFSDEGGIIEDSLPDANIFPSSDDDGTGTNFNQCLISSKSGQRKPNDVMSGRIHGIPNSDEDMFTSSEDDLSNTEHESTSKRYNCASEVVSIPHIHGSPRDAYNRMDEDADSDATIPLYSDECESVTHPTAVQDETDTHTGVRLPCPDSQRKSSSLLLGIVESTEISVRQEKFGSAKTLDQNSMAAKTQDRRSFNHHSPNETSLVISSGLVESSELNTLSSNKRHILDQHSTDYVQDAIAYYKETTKNAISMKTLIIAVTDLQHHELAEAEEFFSLFKSKVTRVNKKDATITPTLCVTPVGKKQDTARKPSHRLLEYAMRRVPIVPLDWMKSCIDTQSIHVPTSFILSLPTDREGASWDGDATYGLAKLATMDAPSIFYGAFLLILGRLSSSHSRRITKLIRVGGGKMIKTLTKKNIPEPFDSSKSIVVLVGEDEKQESDSQQISRERMNIINALEASSLPNIYVVEIGWVEQSIKCGRMLEPINFKPSVQQDLWELSKELFG